MEPTTLLGTVYGVILAKMSPYWLITAAMALLLAFSAKKTFRKGYAKLRSEAGSLASSKPIGSTEPNRGGGKSAYGTIIAPLGQSKDSAERKPRRVWALVGRCVTSVGICYVTVLLLSLVTGVSSDRIPAWIECGTFSFWMCHLGATLVCALVTVSNAAYLRRRVRIAEERAAATGQLQQGIAAVGATADPLMTVDWMTDAVYFYPALCLAAGFMSALVGIGGSTIKGPILLHMGLDPIMAKATSQVMLLTTVSSSAFQFWLRGMLPPYYGLAFFALGCLSGFLGKSAIDWYVRREGRQSMIVFLLAIYIVVAAFTMTTIGVMLVVGQIYGPAPNAAYRASELWFRSLCTELPQSVGALKWVFAKLGI